MLKLIFKKYKNIIGMYFCTKSYLKSNRYHNDEHKNSIFSLLTISILELVFHATSGFRAYVSVNFLSRPFKPTAGEEGDARWAEGNLIIERCIWHVLCFKNLNP